MTKESNTHTSIQGTWGVILYSIITLYTGRGVSLTLHRRICLSSVSVLLSVLSPLHHHMYLFYVPFSVSVRLNPSLLTGSSYHPDSLYSLIPLAINNRNKNTYFQCVFRISKCDIELFFKPNRSCESSEAPCLHLLICKQYRFTITREIDKG